MAALHPIVNLGRASAKQTLRPFPAVACRLMKLVSGTANTDFGEVSRVLMADAAFSSQVLRVAEAERKLCDADYCQVGDSLAMSWNFSPELGDVIAHHHDEVTSETPRMRLLVQAACTAANMSGFHVAGPEQKWDPARLELLLPQGSELRQPCGDLMEKGASKLNRIECRLL